MDVPRSENTGPVYLLRHLSHWSSRRRSWSLEKRSTENEIRGTLRVFGLKLSGRIQHAAFEARALELVADRPRLAAMVRPMLAARAGLREQCAVLHRMMLLTVKGDNTCMRLVTVPGLGALTAVLPLERSAFLSGQEVSLQKNLRA